MRRVIKKIIRKHEDFKKRISNVYYLSIGENCLTDNILDRHKIKSFSTPYSHGRSNLDYAIALEEDNYKNLLNPDSLKYEYAEEMEVVRNKRYLSSDDIYNKLHQNGFEFTHHDVIKDNSQKESYERKILRMQSLDNQKKIKFLYHYRNNENKDFKLIIKKAGIFLSYYKRRNIKCEFVFFTQDIVLKKEDRSLIKITEGNDIKGFVFKTMEVWEGDDPEVLWARKDEDLIRKMIKKIK